MCLCCRALSSLGVFAPEPFLNLALKLLFLFELDELSRASSCFSRSSDLFVAEETPELRDPSNFELECFNPAVFTLECFDPADFTSECFEAETLDRSTGQSANKSAISSAATPCCSS